MAINPYLETVTAAIKSHLGDVCRDVESHPGRFTINYEQSLLDDRPVTKDRQPKKLCSQNRFPWLELKKFFQFPVDHRVRSDKQRSLFGTEYFLLGKK